MKIFLKESISYCCIPFNKKSVKKEDIFLINSLKENKKSFISLLCKLSCCLTSVQLMVSYFSAGFPRPKMSLFSRISVFFSGCSRVFETMALATIWIGTDMELEPKADIAEKNFLASHSAGRLSCLSTNKTLEHKDLGGYWDRIGKNLIHIFLMFSCSHAVTGTWSTCQ